MIEFNLSDIFVGKKIDKSKVATLIRHPYVSINVMVGKLYSEPLAEYERDRKIEKLLSQGIIYNESLSPEEKLDEVFNYYTSSQNKYKRRNESIHRIVVVLKGSCLDYVFNKVVSDVRLNYELGWMYFTESALLYPESFDTSYVLRMNFFNVNSIYSFVGLSSHKIEKDLPLRRMDQYSGSFSFDFGLQQEIYDEESIRVLSNDELVYELFNPKFEYLVRAIDAHSYTRLYLEGEITLLGVDIGVLSNVKKIVGSIVYSNSKIRMYENEVKVSAKVIDTITLFNYAFSVANFGGAYESGLFNAMAKKAAWEFMCGVQKKEVGSVSKDELHENFSNCLIVEFTTNTGIFINEWFDLGVFVLNKENNHFTLLCVSDTD